MASLTTTLLKSAVFTVLAPGTVAVVIPYLLLSNPSLSRIDVEGWTFVGILPLVLGVVLYVRCVVGFARGGGTPAPIDAPKMLVTAGPYRYSRNAMYIGVLSVIAGEALLFREPRLVYYLLIVFAVFHGFVTLYEERALLGKFGEAYARYTTEVPRWFPRWTDLLTIHRSTFQRVGAFVLAAGVVAHVLRLTVGLPVAETPPSIHALLVLLPGYAVLGCVAYRREIRLDTPLQRTVFYLVTTLLAITAVMHAYSIVAATSAWLGRFPIWYSVVAAVAYGGFALFLETRERIPSPL